MSEADLRVVEWACDWHTIGVSDVQRVSGLGYVGAIVIIEQMLKDDLLSKPVDFRGRWTVNVRKCLALLQREDTK